MQLMAGGSSELVSKPYVVVVTGGAGAGKSTAAHHFERLGAVIIDADEIAREVLEEPQVRDGLLAEFGPTILDASGGVDRALLAEAAFRGTQSVARLNRVTHPRIEEVVLARLAALEDDPAVKVVVLDVPILGGAPMVAARADAVVAIEAPVSARVARLVHRGIPEPDARRRIALQLTDTERRVQATAVVVNDGDAVAYEERLDRVWDYVTEARQARSARRETEGGARA